MVNETTERVYKIKNDVVFKELFSKEGNEEFLQEFLSALLKLNIEKIEIQKEVELTRGNVIDKLGVIDIKAMLNDNTIVDIEMQIVDQDNIIERTTDYSSNLISMQLKVGEDYNKLKPVIIVAILDYNFIPYDEYISETVIVLDKHREYEINEYQKYYYIELPKFRKENLEVGNKVSEWLTFIDGENKKRVREVMENNKLIKKADNEYKYLVGEERIRRLAELKRRTSLEINSAKAAGYMDGKKEGLEEGINEGTKKGKIIGSRETSLNIAKSLLNKNIDIDVISEVTKLSVEEIKKLK